MKVICAWCEQEGKPSYLGEREPYDNRATTHGICSRHKEEALQALSALSFPDVEMLIVVRRNGIDLYEYLLRRFTGVRGVKVILERRQPDRPVNERDRKERRIRQGTISPLGYTVVRFKRGPPPSDRIDSRRFFTCELAEGEQSSGITHRSDTTPHTDTPQ